MTNDYSSVIIGTSGLTVAAIIALLLAVSRRSISTLNLPRVRRLTVLGILLQVCHFSEEYRSQFYVRFPEVLGLRPWSATFFASFNLAWVTIWVGCIALLRSYPRTAISPIWFLGIASAANGVVHPILSLTTSGYFPGLWTSPLVGILGVVLLRTLASSTSKTGTRHEAP
jgi:hypothetical protein